MIKKILPLALCGLLAGCAAIKEFQPLQSGLQTFFVRSLVVAKPAGGGEDKHAFLIWASTGDKITAMKRGSGVGATPADTVNIDTNTSFHDDQGITPGGTYVYAATFGEKTLTRSIKVLAKEDAGKVTATAPDVLRDPQAGVAAAARPTFSWTLDQSDGKASGFLVSVVKADNVNSTAGLAPVYTAFLDAASHSAGVAYGTPSDMSAITKELLDALASADSKYAKKDGDVPDLEKGAKYVWLVAPIAVDKEKASFAIGDQSAAAFQVAP
ncbi:MAG TPA: hypothetical protein V6D00_13990 [Pantanalinema sp.]